MRLDHYTALIRRFCSAVKAFVIHYNFWHTRTQIVLHTNDYTVVSFPYVLPEAKDGGRVDVDPSTTGLGDLAPHKSHRVSKL
jgi:hypothetical protein